MTDWSRYIKQTVVRRVIYVVVSLAVALVLSMVNGKAHAHGATNAGMADAYQHCMADKTNGDADDIRDGYDNYKHECYAKSQTVVALRICTYQSIGGPCGPWSDVALYAAIAGCTGTTTFDIETQSCVDKNEACKALNDQPGRDNMAGVTEVRQFSSKCLANGCMFGGKPGTGMVCTTALGETSCSGEFVYTGACPTAPAADAPGPNTVTADPKPKRSCVTYGSGQKMCHEADGRQCYTTTNGRENCFRPGETGTKTDQNKVTKREPGPTPTPITESPTGKPVTQDGESKTTTTTTSPGGTTITTTTTIYQTTDGTEAGGSNEGEPDADDGGSASGGGDCKTSPWFVGGDETLRMIATQAWATRCAVEAGNAAKVTGDIGDCASPFAVEGDNANAVKMRAMRKQICPDGTTGDAEANSYGMGDTTGVEEGVRDGVIGGTGNEIGADGLDEAGFGWARSCPSIPTVDVMGTTIDLNSPVFCDWMQLGGQLVILMAALASLRIIAGPG